MVLPRMPQPPPPPPAPSGRGSSSGSGGRGSGLAGTITRLAGVVTERMGELRCLEDEGRRLRVRLAALELLALATREAARHRASVAAAGGAGSGEAGGGAVAAPPRLPPPDRGHGSGPEGVAGSPSGGSELRALLPHLPEADVLGLDGCAAAPAAAP
jgi:hypothetical protein